VRKALDAAAERIAALAKSRDGEAVHAGA